MRMLFLAAGLAGAMVPAPAVAVGAEPGPAVPALVWQVCAPDLADFECAAATVPLDYDRPRGAQITLALTRLPATDKARRIGSLFLNPGGPGASGVDFVQAVGKQLYTAEVRARFDLVGFDPRGIASSTPAQCYDTTAEALAALPPFAFPFTPAEERVWIASNRAYAAACARRAGPIIDHMSTANVARDLDLLRRAVGDQKMNFAGYSYGSYIGTTYANMFPDRVRAVIIDGVINPVSWSTGRGNEAKTSPVDARLVSEQGSYQTLLGFLRLCDRGGDNCAFSAGDPKRRYDRLAKRLRAEPVSLPDGEGGTFTFGYTDLVAVTLGALYNPDHWPDFAVFLQQVDTAQPAAAAAALRTLQARLDEPYEQVQEGFAGVTCSETDNPDHVSAWARAARRADQKYPYFGRIWNWSSSICAFWPGRDADRYTGPFNRRTANTILVIGNRSDPATRYQDAVSTARLLSRSSLITVEGWGHTSLFLSSCVDGHVSRYLLTGQAPRRHTVCGVDVIPFAGPTVSALRAAPLRPGVR